MARFKPIDEGTLARKRGVPFSTIYGQSCVVDLGILSADDDSGIIERASAYARETGNPNPTNNPAYDFRCAVEKVALIAIDPESPDNDPQRYFGSVDQVRKYLDRDVIVYLAKLQEDFQASVSPLKRGLTNIEYAEAVIKMAALKEGGEDPFGSWAPSLRLSFMRLMAVQITSLLELKFNDGSTPESLLKRNTQSLPSSQG